MTAINSNRAIRGPVTAVPVVAGKGVRLVADTENNRWVVEADETVLWDRGTGAATTSMTLSENAENFAKLKILSGNQWSEVTVTNGTCYVLVNSGGNYSTFGQIKCSVSGTSFSVSKSMVWSINYNSTSGTFVNNNSDVNGSITKIVGVGRIAGN